MIYPTADGLRGDGAAWRPRRPGRPCSSRTTRLTPGGYALVTLPDPGARARFVRYGPAGTASLHSALPGSPPPFRSSTSAGHAADPPAAASYRRRHGVKRQPARLKRLASPRRQRWAPRRRRRRRTRALTPLRSHAHARRRRPADVRHPAPQRAAHRRQSLHARPGPDETQACRAPSPVAHVAPALGALGPCRRGRRRRAAAAAAARVAAAHATRTRAPVVPTALPPTSGATIVPRRGTLSAPAAVVTYVQCRSVARFGRRIVGAAEARALEPAQRVAQTGVQSGSVWQYVTATTTRRATICSSDTRFSLHSSRYTSTDRPQLTAVSLLNRQLSANSNTPLRRGLLRQTVSYPCTVAQEPR